MPDESPNQFLGNAAPPDESLKLRQYWHVILERRWLIISSFTVIFVLSVIYAFKATPIFEASARLQIDRESSGVLNLSQTISLDSKELDYLQTQYRNLQSRSLIEQVIAELKLDEDERYKKQVDKPRAVLDDVNVVPIRLTRLVDIRVRHPNARRAADMANKLVLDFLQQNQDRKTTKAMAAYRMLKTEVTSLEGEYSQAIQGLHTYRVEKKMVSFNSEYNILQQSLRNAQTESDMARGRAAEALKTKEEAQRWVRDGQGIQDLKQTALDQVIVNLKAGLNAREGELAQLLTKYKDKHPEVIRVRQAIENDRKKLTAESGRIFSAILSEADLAKAKENQLATELKRKEDEVARFNELQIEYELLQRKADRAKFMYEQVLARFKESDLNTKDTIQNMTIIDPANVPVRPVKPNKILVLLLGMIGGLSVALGLAFFVNFLDDSVKSQEDVETYLRLPFLGYIPNIKSASVVERDLQSHLHPTSSAAEGFRTLRAAISLARNADKLRVVAVTSTIPSEGKSLVASNFAIVTAQTGLRTLLIDADLRRPSVHKAFQLQSPTGLSSYLAERVNNVTEFIHPTEVPNLDVVCCGAAPSNPSELIGSKRMLQFLEEVSTRYDRVVLDCPPVSAVADPLIVGAMCDGIMFVTKFNKIRREHALRSVQRLQDAGIHIVGLVLNDIDFEGKDSYYYSYHYYQNRYYATHYRSKAGGDKKQTPAKKA